MAKSKGLIVYFDGPDGAGKTTQLKLVAQSLVDYGQDVHVTRVLGGSAIGELLREAVLSDTPRPVETDLNIAIACYHALAADLNKRRSEGEIVLVDRSPLSIIAYQVFGDELPSDVGYKAAEDMMKLIKPDLTLVYLAEAEELVERRRQRNHRSGINFFENKPIEYHQRVVQGFKESAKHFDTKTISAVKTIESMQDETQQYLAELMNI